MNNIRFGKAFLFTNALIPLGLLVLDAKQDRLGANPLEFFLRTVGVLALVFLLLTLAVTPVRKSFKWNNLIKVRRMLGLFAFFYAAVHLVTYGIFDKSLRLQAIAEDVWKRPFIALGMAAFIILIPLAITSTNAAVKRLGGKNWVRLHKLSYLAAILAVIHFWMIVKSDVFYPFLFACTVTFLLGYRAVVAANKA